MPQTHQGPVPHYDVETELEGNVLTCTLVADTPPGDNIVWTLHRGDFNPRRATKPVLSGNKWRVQLPDTTSGYIVRATVGNTIYQSRWLQYFNSKSIKRYEQWLESWRGDPTGPPRPIDLFKYEPPFENIAFVCHSEGLSLNGLDELVEENNLQIETHTGLHWPLMTVLSKRGSTIDNNGTHYIFSGVTRDTSRLLHGRDDVEKYVPHVRKLRDEIGEFHMLDWDEESVTFSHDYIGQGHLFYYKDDQILAAANGLHLLALTLRALGIPLHLNLAASKAKFFSTSYPFEYHHGVQTDFENIQRISVYERLEITNGGVKLLKTQSWQDSHDGELTEDLYEELLAEAKQDIIDNVRIALDHPSFDNVIVELSAGLDSRIIYSALTNLPPSNKVRIYTRSGSEQRTAAAINNLYGFAWDDLPRINSHDRGSGHAELPMSSHSVFMDGYYIESMFKPRQGYVQPTLVLTGHGGEAFSRVMSIEGYFARDFSGELPAPITRIDEVFANTIRYIGNHQVWLDAGDKWFAHILYECIQDGPSEEFAKRFADIYVSQRNPFVGGSVFRGAMSAPQWRPIQSKSLFRLRSLWFQHGQDYRLQFDLIRSLNPLISEVPYDKPVVTARKDEFHTHRPRFSLRKGIDFEDLADRVEIARAKSEESSVWMPSREYYDEIRRTTRAYEESADSFLEPLRYILTLAPEFADMGLPLFTYVDRVINRDEPRSFSKRHNVRNKLHILLQEVLISASRHGETGLAHELTEYSNERGTKRY